MSTDHKRRMELLTAMAATNNTGNLKRKKELANALTANGIANEPTENSSLRNLNVSSRNKRVFVPPTKSSISNSLTRQSATNPKTSDKARVHTEDLHVQHVTNASNEHTGVVVTESVVDTVDKADAIKVGQKRGRGLTRGLNTQKYKRISGGEKPKIVIPKGINRPVGEHSSKHATEIGVLIRCEAPMQVEGWAKIPDETKDHLLRKLTNKLSYELEEPHVVQCIWKSFAKQYSSFRSNAHKYYLKWKEGRGVTLARQNIYEKLGDRRDDWLWLCDFWETSKFEKVSNTQKSNRKKLTYSHKLGTKSRAAHQHEKGIDDIDMYEVEYHNPKNGWAYKDFEANSVRMKELREQQRALPEGVDRMTTEEICITVLGENSSYAKSKGLNRKVSRVDAISSFEASSSRARLEEELANTQSELASTKAEMAIQKTTVEAVVKFMEQMTGKSFAEIINVPNW